MSEPGPTYTYLITTRIKYPVNKAMFLNKHMSVTGPTLYLYTTRMKYSEHKVKLFIVHTCGNEQF